MLTAESINKDNIFLKEKDVIALITPAFGINKQEHKNIINWLEKNQIKYDFVQDIADEDLFFAGTTEKRVNAFKQTLLSDKYKAIWALRGGYGSALLIPELMKLKPKNPKILIGFSDITALHILFNQYWRWPSLHADVLKTVIKADKNSSQMLLDFLYQRIDKIYFQLKPLNKVAEQENIIKTTCVGGNLSVLQCSLATIWQFNTSGKIVILEDIDEKPYRIDRMLNHLIQANIFNDAAAIILGEFKGCFNNEVEENLFKEVINRFANSQNIPILQTNYIGHNEINYPVPFGFVSKLQLGRECLLEISNRVGI